jgi:hypothetical protein
MAQTYTLDEAAEKLNLSVEDFKRRLRTEWTQIRSFRDGATLRFRANEIDELARSYGLGSSDELPLAEGGGQADIPTQGPAPPHDAPLQLDDSDETFQLTPGGSSAGHSSGRHKGGKPDSDVRLEKAGPKKPAGPDDEESILTEEFEVPSAGGSGKLSGKSGKLSASQLKSGDSGTHKAAGPAKEKPSGSSGKLSGSSGRLKGEKKAGDSSSEFELSLDPDSDEFELSLAPDSSEEVALGEMPPEAGSGSKKSGNSGINLNRPTDSGVSLEKKKPAADDEIDFELSLDAPGSGASAKKLSSGKLKADSDSEFELTLEEPSDLGVEPTPAGEKKGDIFEATDFEIPALEDDSASEAVSLDEADTDLESSDFDLALDEGDAAADDESASEVVALDEAGGGRKKKAKRRPVVDDEAVDLSDPDLEEGPSASKALRGVRHDEDDEEDYEVSEAADVDEEGRPVVVAGPTRWGALPAILMFPTVLFMFLGTLMAFEMLHSTWGYQQANRPTTPLVDFFADKAGLKSGQ